MVAALVSRRTLSTREAAAVVGVHPATVRLWIQSGRLHTLPVPVKPKRTPQSELERLGYGPALGA